MTVETDEKKDISELYLAFSKIENTGLTEDGTLRWKIANICNSVSTQDVKYLHEPSNIHPYAALLRPEELSLPIISIHNNLQGPALWILAGMYGDEPSGPNMLAKNIEYIAQNLSDTPTVILPLCNPHGYRLGQRFLNQTVENIDGLSVDDASNVLFNDKPNSIDYMEGYTPRSEACTYESEHIIRHLLKENYIRPPIFVIDLQEEKDSTKGHIDSYGMKRYEDAHANKIVEALAKTVDMAHYTPVADDRWIVKSIGYPLNDNTIAEFIAAKRIIYGDIIKGIGARTVIKTKVPAQYVSLETRIQAQQNALYEAIAIAKSDILKKA